MIYAFCVLAGLVIGDFAAWLIASACHTARVSETDAGTTVSRTGAPSPLSSILSSPARFEWHKVMSVAHHNLVVDAMTEPMQVREESPPYGDLEKN